MNRWAPPSPPSLVSVPALEIGPTSLTLLLQPDLVVVSAPFAWIASLRSS